MTEREHVPVLLDEVLTALALRPDGIYVDTTFGRGGHAEAILARLNDRGRLLALDRDPQAVEAAGKRFMRDKRVTIIHSPFSRLSETVTRHGFDGQVNGVLFDLGVSSPQLDDPARGFSFRYDAPLDMRMDPTRGESAAQWLARADEAEIARVIHDYGEERFARRIARALVEQRTREPIITTSRLADIVRAAVRTRERGQHPATRTFQAIRIHVNAELDEITQALPQALQILAAGGRLVVISFHSLEDRVVKNFLRVQEKGPDYPPELPVVPTFTPRLRTIGKAVRASASETTNNPRARSAILRVAERTEAAYA